jgi:hypothetical protein
MCRILDVSTSGYYKWRSKALSKRYQLNLVLLEEIKKYIIETEKGMAAQELRGNWKLLVFMLRKS